MTVNVCHTEVTSSTTVNVSVTQRWQSYTQAARRLISVTQRYLCVTDWTVVLLGCDSTARMYCTILLPCCTVLCCNHRSAWVWLYCTNVLYCATVIYCTCVLHYCVVLYEYNVRYYCIAALYNTVLHFVVLYYTVRYYCITAQYCTAVPHCTVLCYIALGRSNGTTAAALQTFLCVTWTVALLGCDSVLCYQ